jgi:hypothetical protein
MGAASFLLHPLAVLLLVIPAAARADCCVRFLPGNSLGQPAGRIEVAHGRNDSPGLKFFLVSRGGYCSLRRRNRPGRCLPLPPPKIA